MSFHYEGRLPYSDKLRAPTKNRSWGFPPNQSRGAEQSSYSGEDYSEDVGPGEEGTSPERNHGRGYRMDNSKVGQGGGRGGGCGDGRGRERGHAYRKIEPALKNTSMLLDQDTLNKKRLNEMLEESSGSKEDSRDSKKKKAGGDVDAILSVEAEVQPRESQ